MARSPSALVIASSNSAAGVALRHGLPLVVVPAGTLNHLARDLGVETLEDAVEAVRLILPMPPR